MKSFRLLFPVLLLTIIIASCGRSESHREAAEVVSTDTTSVAGTDVASAALAGNLTDPSRKIVHTADFNCRVKDVFQTTDKLEKMVRSVGGIVSESTLENQKSELHTQPYTEDSLRQVQEYRTVAHLTLRVPVKMVDSLLDAIPQYVDFMERRQLRLQDVTYQYMANQWQQEGRGSWDDKALQHAKSTKDVIAAADRSQSDKMQDISNRIDNMHIDDNTRFATITLDIFQPSKVDVLIVPNGNYIARTPLSKRLMSGLRNGVEMIESVFVFFMYIWPLLVLAGVAYFVFRIMKKRRLAVN
ncbi:DUF4349 domain-containing protein [Taibaiella soli]|uniref:DUF4349 domain-containing protein n=1 Tax=Taibaiella soli TaxID=1649169 RepID=A0A2W2B2W1_9BACT|nr:DUF4349 domain-containing protein [Taibaiella soli]PZF74388.1 hypothetical protein DN068_02070 [Taibaiella soli]